MRSAVMLLVYCFISFGQVGPVGGGGSGGGSATPGGTSGAVQYNNTGALGGNVLLSAFNPTGGGYLSATLDASGGAPNSCPAWYWGSAGCPDPSALMLDHNLTGDLSLSGFNYTGLSTFANYTHNGATPSVNLMGQDIQAFAGGTGEIVYLYGQNNFAFYRGGNKVDNLWAQAVTAQTNGHVDSFVGQYTQVAVGNGGSATNEYGYWVTPEKFGTGSSTNAYMFYSDDLSGLSITNPYYGWYDSRGVRRVKEDNTFDSVGQAIEALYNPQFAKYTAGATDYERVVLGQWNGNVAEIGNQAGGTGTLRPLRLIGDEVQVPSKTFTNLGTPPGNGTVVYCSDCAITSGIDDTCAASGSGASAERVNGVWRCRI